MSVWNHAESKPSRVNQFFERRAFFMGLAMFGGTLIGVFTNSNLDRANHRGHVVNTPAFSARSSADKALIHFDRMLAADTVPLWPDHSRPEFVQDLEGGFITGKSKLPLELKSGLAWSLCCDQIGTPEPG